MARCVCWRASEYCGSAAALSLVAPKGAKVQRWRAPWRSAVRRLAKRGRARATIANNPPGKVDALRCQPWPRPDPQVNGRKSAHPAISSANKKRGMDPHFPLHVRVPDHCTSAQRVGITTELIRSFCTRKQLSNSTLSAVYNIPFRKSDPQQRRCTIVVCFRSQIRGL